MKRIISIFIKNIISKLSENKSCIVKIMVLVLLLFGTNIYLSYATDSYPILTYGFQNAAVDTIARNGRLIAGLIYKLHYLSGLSNISFYYISSALALILLAISIWIYQGILKKYDVKENIRILLSFAAIANIFIIEYFMFIEKCVFMLAILLNVMGVFWIEKFFLEKKKRYYFFTVMCILLAIFSYQGTIALFVILSIPFAMKRARNFREYILNGFLIGVAYVIPASIDLLLFKLIIKSTRLVQETNYKEALRNVLSGITYNGKRTFDILPKYLFLIVAFVIFIVLVALAVVSGRCVWKIFNAIIIIIASCTFSTATILQGSGWWATRTVYPIASIAAVLAIDIFINGGDVVPPNEFIKKALRAVSVASISVLLIFQYLSFNKIYIDKYKLNAIDQYRYQYIFQKICDYQEKSGIEVEKIAIYNDAKKSWAQYSDLYSTGDLVMSSFLTFWSDVEALNYYMQTDYERINPIDKYTEYFAEKNWNHLSDDQLIFDGDTLHLCVY